MLSTIETEKRNTYHFPSNLHMRDMGLRTEQVEMAVVRFVQKLGIRPNLAGYHLLIRAIMLSLSSPELMDSLSKGLYPVVAKEYGKNPRSVERNMRKAIDSAYEYDPERIKSTFYYKVGKPYISEVISMAVETVRCEAISGIGNNC